MSDKPEGDRVILPSLETPTLTKAELAELLFERLGLNKRESKDMVEAFFDEIRGALVRGDDVKLSGFGNFNIRARPAARAQPAHRRVDSHQGAPGRHVSRQPQAQVPVQGDTPSRGEDFE
jgi:integration host factor subunit alpha